MEQGNAIGIDLGTTNSCVAIVRNGKVEIIANELGHFTTPSYVAFNHVDRVIGDVAKRQLASNATNTVFDVKRLIGRKFGDAIVQKDMKLWPFDVIDVDDKPKVQVTFKDDVKWFTAEEISAMVLAKMKTIAEAYLNKEVKNAVVTVPAYFNDLQRKATKDAGTIAGLNILRIVNEPTAAALAYGLNSDTTIAKNILVYDLGGGTFDVSILNIRDNVYEVKATGGDTHLGGEDFDNILVHHFAAEFKRKQKIDISENKRALRRLRAECERAKQSLSSTTYASIEIDALCDGIDFSAGLTRARFNELCANLFQMTIKMVKRTLKDAELDRDDIDTVVLVGGSTRIVKIQDLLQELFEGKEICRSIDADQAVAYGAAIQASMIFGNGSEEMQNMKLLEVTPLSLGIGVGFIEPLVMNVILKRNTTIPISKSRTLYTTLDDQSIMTISVLQGERYLAKDNFEIGKMILDGIPAAPKCVEKVTVTFSIDANGILNVVAVSNSNRNARSEITIRNVCGSLTKGEIERMAAEAASFRAQDNKEKQYRTARCELEEYCCKLKTTPGCNRNVYEKCNEVLAWLETCVRPTVTQFAEYKNVLEELASMPADKKTKIGKTTIKKKDEKNNSSNEVILLSDDND